MKSTPAYDGATALIVVDVQRDFADATGSLYVPGSEEIVPLVNAEIGRACQAGAFVVYTQDWHPPHTPHFAPDGGIWPIHCVGDTHGAEFVSSLVIAGPVVRKGSEGNDGYSGFTTRDPHSGTTYPTELESLLRQRDVARVVVVGLATDYCVQETAVDAARLGFATTVLRSAVRAVDLNPGDGARALAAMQMAGVRLQ